MQKIFPKINEMLFPEGFPEEEWESDKQLVSDGINKMESYLQTSNSTEKQKLRTLLTKISLNLLDL